MLYYSNISLLPLFLSFASSFIICFIIIITTPLHKKVTLDVDEGIQKFHMVPTPRVGGLGIFIGLVIAYFTSDHKLTTIIYYFILFGFFPFFFGLLEDLTKTIKIIYRLIATLISGVIGWYISDASIKFVGINYIDCALSYQFISVIFTAFSVGGISNSINIIDGLNGLASFTIIVSLTAIGSIALSVGDINLAIGIFILACSVFGFFILNWPFGKLFLGDGGAYLCGSLLAWSCILLIERNNPVAPFAMLLICVYPFTEALFSIKRRLFSLNSITNPDALHLHSLIYRRYGKILNKVKRTNSHLGILIGILNIPPALLAYLFKYNNLTCAALVIIFMCAYYILYKRIINFKLF